jgi:predicted alpha-1,2-mannosidase
LRCVHAWKRNTTHNPGTQIARVATAGLLAALAAAALLAPAASALASGPVSQVDVFAGTRPGPGTFGGGHDFPGAAMPFGMVQFSPDTTADGSPSGGYDYRDHHVTGFSLTHLSGAGCPLYADFPLMATTAPLSASPAAANGSGLLGSLQPGFSHGSEHGSPGLYSVRLNPVGGGAIGVDLTATTRTGMARFSFPASPSASVLIDAGGSAQPDDLAAVSVDPGSREISGSASSGLFCNQRPRYRVYFAAVFSRPFAAFGTWRGARLEPGSTAAEALAAPAQDPRVTAKAGAYASFDTRGARTVTARVGVSFVSVADARANLAAESRGSFGQIAARARRRWSQALGRVEVSGGSAAHLATFYTALYHALLAPRTFSDVGGAYPGMDGAVHRARGYVQYADFSGWDIYRSEVQLLALLEPQAAGDMMRSLLADAAQSGCLPRWSYANGQSMTMVGDPADPILASAAAFGAGFDRGAALAAMIRGASAGCRSANGEYVERQGLAGYLAHGYVPFDLDSGERNANSLSGDPEAVWGSAATSLEYAVDDFAIAQFAARFRHDHRAYREFIRRSAHWRRLYEPRSGMIEPRYASGAFPQPYDNLSGPGFVEGDSAQYTWMVPQDPGGLIAKMGGPAAAAGRLHRFLRALNGGQGATESDHALLGNEPTLQTPWLYDWMGRPYATEEAVRRALTLYRAAPDGYPGNDDLGTLSAWYVFAALGIYPEVPGVGVLALATPLFRHAEIHLAHRRRAVLDTHGRGIYVNSLRVDGRPQARPWTTYCELSHGAELDFALQQRPNRRWGAAPNAAPPSFGPQRRMPTSSCRP